MDSKYVYDKTRQVTEWTDAASLATSNYKSLGDSSSCDFIFRTVLNPRITQVVYLEDILRVLLADQCTIWQDIEYKERWAVLIIGPGESVSEIGAQEGLQLDMNAFLSA